MAQSRRSRGALFAAIAIGWGVVAFVRGARLTPVRVAGDSMEPTLHDGDLVVVAPPRAAPELGAIVVVRRPGGVEDVKRVVGSPGDHVRLGSSGIDLGPGRFAIAGDNRSRSTDSRHYGPVAMDDIVAVVRACYWPPSSWRLFPR